VKTGGKSSSAKKNLPLRGRRVLVGRARHQASALSAGLRALGASVLEIPFIEIRKPRTFRPLDNALRNLKNYDWLILTSVNGVDALHRRMEKLRKSIGELRHLQIAAIGPATKKAISGLGLRVHVVPKEYVAEAVVRSLRRRVRGRRVLLVRAKVARDVIPRELRRAGATVDVAEAYETVIPRSSRVRLRAVLKSSRPKPDVITFTSSSTVRNFVSLFAGTNRAEGKASRQLKKLLAGVRLASIGPVTSATMREVGLRPEVQAREYTIPGLIQAIVRTTERE
jgi:uroporphyrinogen-III synthase